MPNIENLKKQAKQYLRWHTREGLVMLFGLTLMSILMLWLILSGIVRIND
jgi:hypothetical protein